MKKLNFGCVKDIKNGYVNVDIARARGVDRVFDFNKFPYPFANNYKDIPLVMKELHRITKPEGTIRIIVPHYHAYGAYNDVTHRHYFSHLLFEPFYKPTARGKLFLFDFIRKPLSFIFG